MIVIVFGGSAVSDGCIVSDTCVIGFHLPENRNPYLSTHGTYLFFVGCGVFSCYVDGLTTGEFNPYGVVKEMCSLHPSLFFLNKLSKRAWDKTYKLKGNESDGKVIMLLFYFKFLF